MAKVNRYGQHCASCGRWVKPGEGYLFFVQDDDEALYGGHAGWLVRHLDASVCQKAIAEDEAADKARKEQEEALERERQELQERAARESGLECKPDWSWDNYAYSYGQEIASSEHYIAYQYLDCGKCVGFTIVKRK